MRADHQQAAEEAPRRGPDGPEWWGVGVGVALEPLNPSLKVRRSPSPSNEERGTGGQHDPFFFEVAPRQTMKGTNNQQIGADHGSIEPDMLHPSSSGSVRLATQYPVSFGGKNKKPV